MSRRHNRSHGSGDADFRPLINSSVNAFVRLDRRAQLIVVAVLAVAGLIAAVWYVRSHQPQQAGTNPPAATQPAQREPGGGGRPSGSRRPGGVARTPGPPAASVASANLLLGNPSSATADAANKSNYLLAKTYYTLAWNDPAGTARWVSWRVAAGDLGDAPRKQGFDPENELPAGFTRIVHKDYDSLHTGFDRGHLCPHGDRDANDDSSFATFVMTNVIPQAPNVNQKAWANLENYCRDLVRAGNRLYIVAGPTGVGGRTKLGSFQTIANGKVTVPAECWKVIVVVPESIAGDGAAGSEDDLSRIDPATRVIAVIMPNDESKVGEPWTPYRTTPAEIERKTGLTFFSRVRPEVAAALRQKRDEVNVPPPKPWHFERN